MTDTIKRLCVRTKDGASLGPPLPGTVVMRCGVCGADVWYDPMQPMPEGLQKLYCLQCAVLDPELAPEVFHMLDNPDETRQRLLDALKARRKPE